MDEKNIGTLARFMGVSPHTIKYYDKIGLLNSGRDEKTNYRRYELSICTDLAECIKYRSMGFSLKELDVLRKTADESQVEEMLVGRLAQIESEIKKLTGLRDFLKDYNEDCKRVEKELGEWYVVPCDKVYYCRMQTKNLSFTDAKLAADAVNIMDYAPKTMAVAILDKKYMEGGEPEFSWGQSLSFSERQPLFENMLQYTCIAPEKIFITYRRYTGAYIANGEMAEDLRTVFHQYAQVFPDHVYAFRIKITHDEEGRDWNYFKILVPLK